MTHGICRYWVYAVLIFGSMVGTLVGDEATAGESIEPVRVAVIDSASRPDFSEMLENVCQENTGIHLLERSRLNVLVREKRIQELLENRNWQEGCRLLNAEMLVLIGMDSVSGSSSNLYVRIVSANAGVVMAEHRFDYDPAKREAQVLQAYSVIRRELPKVRLHLDECLVLSAPALVAEIYSPTLLGLERKFMLELFNLLVNHPRIILLERAFLDSVMWEQSITAENELAAPTAVLNGSISLQNGNVSLIGSLMIAGRKPVEIRAEAPGGSTDVLARNVVAQISSAADLEVMPTWMPSEEAALFAQLANTMLHHGMIPEAAAAADSAFALGCRERQLLNVRVRAHSLLAYPVFWHEIQDHIEYLGSLRRRVLDSPRIKWQDVVNERWRIAAAVRSMDALQDALPHIDPAEDVTLEENIRIVGSVACRNASRILLSAEGMGLMDQDTNGQFSYLREQIIKSIKYLQELPHTRESYLVWQITGNYLTLWYDNLDERLEAYASFLQLKPAHSNFSKYMINWRRLLHGERLSYIYPIGRPAMPGKSAEYTRLAYARWVHGQIYPWEPDVLVRRAKWLDMIVALTRSTERKGRETGWILWKLWLDTQLFSYNDQHDWIRAEHPTFDWQEEARKAWNLSKDIDLNLWTAQQIYAMTWDMRDDFVTRGQLSLGAESVYFSRFRAYSHENTIKWLEYFATDAPNIPYYLLNSLVYKGKHPREAGQVDERQRALLLACRQRLSKIDAKYDCVTPAQIDEMLFNTRPIQASESKAANQGDDKPKPKRRKKTKAAEDPAKIFISPDLLVLNLESAPAGTRPPAETESVEWWKHWRHKCIWDTVKQYEGSTRRGPFIRAYDPASKNAWIISLPEELLDAIPSPDVMIDETAIYLLGDDKCAHWIPGKGYRIFNMPGKSGTAQIVDGKLYMLISGSNLIGTGSSPTHSGAVYEYDPGTDTVTLLVSSRRTLAKTQLDNCPPYQPMLVFKDHENKLNLIVRMGDADRIYQRNGEWDWKLVATLDASIETVDLMYLRRGGRNFIWVKPRRSARWEEWGILPGEHERLECIYRHSGLDPVFGFINGTPKDTQAPPGSYEYRDGKRYYFFGGDDWFAENVSAYRTNKRIGRPQIEIYDEIGKTTTTFELQRALTPDQELQLKNSGINSSSKDLFFADVFLTRNWMSVESGMVIWQQKEWREKGSQKIYWYVPWTMLDDAMEVEQQKEEERRQREASTTQASREEQMAWETDESGIDETHSPDRLPGEEMTVDLGGGVVLEMIWIPGGSFIMGSPSSELSRSDDERQHRVTLSRGFWMGKYEVTQAQWSHVMGSNPSSFKGASNPVENVSWRDCRSFIQHLNHLSARLKDAGDPRAGTFRFPTEAEWEYACRAGTMSPFHYGNDLDASMANFAGDYPYGGALKGENRKQTIPVGSFAPNRWGLYDMHGNVAEWCQDKYARYDTKNNAIDPEGSKTGGSTTARVYRGGGWINSGGFCRSAIRSRLAPSEFFYLNYLGLRLVMTNQE